MSKTPRDRRFYVSLACYAVASVALLPLTYYYPYYRMILGGVIPVIAILVLIAFQLSARTRCSAFAFCVVFAGVLAMAFVYSVVGIALVSAAAA